MFFVAQEAEAMARAVSAAIAIEGAAGPRTLHVEANKPFGPAGSRDTVDLYVREARSQGPDRVHAFECKPRTVAVDGLDVATFSKRLDVLKVKRGYFVAPAFTVEAWVVAGLDPRIVLLSAAEYPISPLPLQLFTLKLDTIACHRLRSATGPILAHPDTPVQLKGATALLGEVLKYFGQQAMEETATRRGLFQAAQACRVGCDASVALPPGALCIYDIDVTRVEFDIEFTFAEAWPKLRIECEAAGSGVQVEYEWDHAEVDLVAPDVCTEFGPTGRN